MTILFGRSTPAARWFMKQPQPPSSWKRPSSFSSSLNMPLSERKKMTLLPSSPSAVNKGDLFHVIHKLPAGDSPYVKAKQVQLVDKDPARSIYMFWASINAGDRVESSLKDMALVMKQLNRSDEAIEAIKSFRHLCSSESQESLDNILVELYKRSGRIDEEIAMLDHKLKQIEDGVTFVGRSTKQARSQGKKTLITADQEIPRILGNLAWAYMQKGDYKTAEEHYRKALSFEVDRNKQCNLAICLMQMNRITEAKFLLEAVITAMKNRKMDESFTKSFERASQVLSEKENRSLRSEVEEVSHARKRLYDESPVPAIRDFKVRYTKPKTASWGFNDNDGYQRETWGDVNSDPKPSFWSVDSDSDGIWRVKTFEEDAADNDDDSNWIPNVNFDWLFT